MEVFVGTSGWMYKDWEGRFYPSSLKQNLKLTYFSKHFPTVEINSTFYRLPSESAVKNWYGSVPDGFIFSVKLSRYLTHMLKLAPGYNFNEGLDNYISRVSLLKDKLGAVLVQLPPSLQAEPEKISNLYNHKLRLEKKYSINLPLAIEFRHRSWFSEKIISELKGYNIAAVISSGPGRWPETRKITADFTIIRFHGGKKLYASSYSEKELDKWSEFINKSCQKCNKVYCYFNNDQSAMAVVNAKYLCAKFKYN